MFLQRFSQASDPPVDSPKSRCERRRFGVSTLILSIAAIAVWLAFVANRHRIVTLRSRIEVMAKISPGLAVIDPTKIAIVKLDEDWFADNNEWDIYLPTKGYRLRLATRSIEKTGTAPISKSVPIAPGRHRISLEKRGDGSRVVISVGCDGDRAIVIEESPDWAHSTLGTSVENFYRRSEQRPHDQPVALFRERFLKSTEGPTTGILLWIEHE